MIAEIINELREIVDEKQNLSRQLDCEIDETTRQRLLERYDVLSTREYRIIIKIGEL